MNKLIVFPLFFFLLFSITSAQAATNLTYTKDIYDGYIVNTSSYENLTFQTAQTMLVAGRSDAYLSRGYILWNISSLPPGSITINDAEFYFYISSGANINNPYYILVYNTSDNWNDGNLTWYNMMGGTPANGVLQDNKTNVTAGWNKFNITKALQTAKNQGKNLSLMIRLDNESVNGYATQFNAFGKRSPQPQKPYIEVSYTISSCLSSCGDCGCNADNTGCYVPPIVGTYCTNCTGSKCTTVTTVNSSCYTTSFDCPTNTACNQITPQANVTTLLPDTTDCSKCWFVNSYNILHGTWSFSFSNCYPVTQELIDQCDCSGFFCSQRIYTTNTTNQTFSYNGWTAGCFIPATGDWVNMTNETGGATTFDDITKKVCPDCEVSYNGTTKQKQNTSTTCYDASNNIVSCGGGNSNCASNYGGQIAIATASIFGITDCGQSQNITALIISLIVSIVIIFLLAIYGSVSEGLVNMFLGSNLLMLVLFTLIGWFPAWLIVILIIVSALGISGLLSKLLGAG